ncbi:hypothetical protein KT71_09377 [Congregibacter litoralis KT71]|uniref:Uncharacterized protein n=1 Tax=Congregibacter litoralis KT71 TaxID=314285 RepID=A4A4V6_9GAMM|nr:hypothetical protein KT71_09377 [Congregibacter litoralis KT71]
MDPSRNDQGIKVTFEKPVPLLGLHAQHLGFVRRCRLTKKACVVDALELQTSWQSIEIDRSAVSYDSEQGVFKLLKGDALVRNVDW